MPVPRAGLQFIAAGRSEEKPRFVAGQAAVAAAEEEEDGDGDGEEEEVKATSGPR